MDGIEAEEGEEQVGFDSLGPSAIGHDEPWVDPLKGSTQGSSWPMALGPRESKPTCSSPSSASMPSIKPGTNTSNWRRSAIPDCTSQPWPVAYPACPRS